MEPCECISFLYCHAEKNRNRFISWSNYELHMFISSVCNVVPVVSWGILFCYGSRCPDFAEKKHEEYVHKKHGFTDGDNCIIGREYCPVAEVYLQNGFYGLADVHDKHSIDCIYPIPLTAIFCNKTKVVLSGDIVL